MPTFAYEAMDSSGLEVKDNIEAPSEAEAQTMIREKGFYVTKIREKERKKKDTKKGAKGATAKGAKKGKTFTIGGVKPKLLCTFTRQLSTLQDAGLPVLRSLRTAAQKAQQHRSPMSRRPCCILSPSRMPIPEFRSRISEVPVSNII